MPNVVDSCVLIHVVDSCVLMHVVDSCLLIHVVVGRSERWEQVSPVRVHVFKSSAGARDLRKTLSAKMRL